MTSIVNQVNQVNQLNLKVAALKNQEDIFINLQMNKKRK